MEIRIGITQSLREIELDANDETRDEVLSQVKTILASGEGILSITDRKGRQILVSGSKLAYVEFGSESEERKVGFAR